MFLSFFHYFFSLKRDKMEMWFLYPKMPFCAKNALITNNIDTRHTWKNMGGTFYNSTHIPPYIPPHLSFWLPNSWYYRGGIVEFPSWFLFFLKLRGLPGNAGNTVADYYGCAPVLQWLCFRFAITMLSFCNNYAFALQ